MSGSELANGIGSGVSTTAFGVAVAGAENDGLSILGWVAIIMGAIILLSSLALLVVKKYNR